MGRRPIPVNLKKNRQYCVMVDAATADRVEALIVSGRYLAGADLLREALMLYLDKIEAEAHQPPPSG